VTGTIGVAFYCDGCRRLRTRESCTRWQKNNNKHIAAKARERRWKAKGKRAPSKIMTYAERGRLGGKIGQAARIAALGPQRVAEIAAHARAVRWAKYRAKQKANPPR
jgi:hypothetical protein